MSLFYRERKHTPRVEHDGVKEVTDSLNHDRQNTSEIGTIQSASIIQIAGHIRTFGMRKAQWVKP
jgi:hypothetical protein